MRRTFSLLASLAFLGSQIASAIDVLVPSPLDRELQRMQAIEPSYVPTDMRALKLFQQQELVRKNEEEIKAKEEKARSIRPRLAQEFRKVVLKYADEKSVGLDPKLDTLAHEIIQKYEAALKNSPNSPFAADAMYYLGYYYVEVDEKKYFDLFEIYSQAREQGRKDVPYPEENFSRTIELYESLIEKFPNFRHMDSVYYLLALALWYEGAFANAADYFTQLIAKYPQSKFIEEIWFRLGEHYYDRDQFDLAIENYAVVAKNTKSPLYDKALYKMAWAHYQKDRYALAIDYFAKVLSLNYAQGAAVDTSMRAEALRYIIKSFANEISEGQPLPKKNSVKLTQDAEKEYHEKLGVEQVNRVVRHFNRDKEPPLFYKDLLLELASQLTNESKSQGAILALENAMKADPKNEENPLIQAQMVEILQDAGRPEEARLKNRELIHLFDKNSLWFKDMEKNVVAREHARNVVRDAMLSLAVYYQTHAKELREAGKLDEMAKEFDAASILYARYINEYPEHDDTPKAIFYFAEAVYELNRYHAALQAYQLLKDYPLPMPDNIRRDATFNIVFTFRHVLEDEAKHHRFKEIDFDALTSRLRGAQAEEIPPLGLKYLASIDEFLKIAPQDERVPILLFHAAAIYYVYGHIDQALTRFSFLIDTYPRAPAAVVAGRLIIDDAVAKEDWNRVVELSKRYKEENLGGKADDFARMQGTGRFKIARGIFEQANELRKQNQLTEAKAKYQQAAALFQELLKEDPKNPFADVMLLNAARAIEQSGTITQALPLYKSLYSDYPKSEHVKTARFQEALALEKMLKFREAAQAYDGLIRLDPQSQEAADAMLNKGLLYEAAEDQANATAAFLDFANKYPDRPEAPDALLSAAAIYKKMGKITQQIAMLEQFIKRYAHDVQKRSAVIEASSEVSDSYAELAKTAQSPAQKDNYEKLRAQYNNKVLTLYSADLNSPIAAFYAAKARLFLEAPEQEGFKKLRIDARDGKAQGAQLTAMMKKLAELAKKNEDIIRLYAQPVWNAESMYRIGALYEHLATSMVKAPCPKDVRSVDEFACDEYKILLEDKASVLEDKALQAYQQSYEIALSAHDVPRVLLNKVQVALNRMRPGKYQRIGDVIEKPKTGTMVGQGRMLSNGRMASSLHPNEQDPDVPKLPEIPTEVEKSDLPAPPQNEAPQQDLEEGLEKSGEGMGL